MSDTMDRIVEFFETLTPESVPRIGEFYADDAHFKDPFNEVHGVPAIHHIFSQMFVQLQEPRFVVTGRVQQGAQVFLTWEFRFRFRRFGPARVQTIHGASHLQLAPDGRIRAHRDYWDAAEELYEKLPLLGTLMRWLKRRAAD